MNENNDRADLLAAVQKLTDPYVDRKIIIDDEPKVGTDRQVVASLKRDGLIKQLRDAIVGGIGSHEGAAAGRERIPFDTGALALYDAIEKDITKRFVNVTLKPVPVELENTLREWRLAFVDAHDKKRITDDQMHKAMLTMEGWGRKIEAHFDKPKQLEVTINLYRRDEHGNIMVEKVDGKEQQIVERRLPAPCPVCGESYARNPITGDQTFALLLEYMDMGKATIDTAAGSCRFCEAVWTAGSGMRELAWQVEGAEARLNTPVEG